MFGWLTQLPPSPTAFTVGHFGLHWYGFIMAVALLAGVLLAQRLGKRVGIKPEHIADLAVLATVLALIGARMVHVLNTWSYYHAHPAEIVQFWHGGLAFHGVLLGGLIALWFFSRWRKVTAIVLLDVALPALALGQVIGRWGNWLNQELYGKSTALPWGIPIDDAHRLPGFDGTTRFHPLFLYEALGNLLILAGLLALWRWRGRRAGDVASTYLILSPLLRFGLDFLRFDQPMVGFLTNAQVFSLLLMVAGGVLLFTRRHRPVQ